MTDRPWPHPPQTRGSRIRHSWKCSRRGAVVETIRRDPRGQATVVEQCLECGCDDLSWRIEHPDLGGDAA